MITTTDNSKLRSRILHVCIEIQQSLLDDFNRRIVALLETNGLENEEEYNTRYLPNRHSGAKKSADYSKPATWPARK